MWFAPSANDDRSTTCLLYVASATGASVWVLTVVPSTWTSSTASNGAVTELFRYQ